MRETFTYVGSISASPSELAGSLLQSVRDLGLPKGIANSMINLLERVIAKLDDANPANDVSAVAKLGAFINKVEKERGSRLSNASADELVYMADQIVGLI